MDNEREAMPIPMLLWCPMCHERHIDVGEFATRPHHTHACQNCGFVWRPAIVTTVGAQFLPGFNNEASRPDHHHTSDNAHSCCGKLRSLTGMEAP